MAVDTTQPEGSVLDTTPYGAGPDASITDPQERAAVSHHAVTVDGRTIPYTARAGHLTTVDPLTAKPNASFFYVSYTADGLPPSGRPVTFLYNGGPGSSAVFLLLGSFAPRRIRTSLPDFTPPAPYTIEDNPDTLLDLTDLVFIDPVGTGYSAAVAPKANRDFWGVDADAESIVGFVKRYLSAFDRWNSPKFLFGESYGTARSCVVGWKLHEDGVDLNGIVLQSSILDYGQTGNPVGLLPTLAADAWYHGRTDVTPPPDLPSYMAEVRAFASGPYDPARRAFPKIDEGVLDTLVRDLGVDRNVLISWGLDVSASNAIGLLFLTALLRDKGLAIGGYDGRATAVDTGIAATVSPNAGANDPTLTNVGGVYTAMWNQYLNDELKFISTSPFTDLNDQTFQFWNFGHIDPTGAQKGKDADGNTVLYTAGDLAAAMALNPDLKVFQASGYYDSVTPFYQTELTLAAMPLLDARARANLEVHNYPSGHMVYLDPGSRTAMKADLVGFYGSAVARAAASARVAASVAPFRSFIAYPPVLGPSEPHDASARPWTVPDLCAAYSWPTGLAGGGTIAIVELGGGWIQSDMDAFFGALGQPVPSIIDVSIDGSGNAPSEEADGEVALDIQVAAAAYFAATGHAAAVRVYWAGNVPGAIAASIRRAAADGCDVCSISWGAAETVWERLEGQTGTDFRRQHRGCRHGGHGGRHGRVRGGGRQGLVRRRRQFRRRGPAGGLPERGRLRGHAQDARRRDGVERPARRPAGRRHGRRLLAAVSPAGLAGRRPHGAGPPRAGRRGRGRPGDGLRGRRAGRAHGRRRHERGGAALRRAVRRLRAQARLRDADAVVEPPGLHRRHGGRQRLLPRPRGAGRLHGAGRAGRRQDRGAVRRARDGWRRWPRGRTRRPRCPAGSPGGSSSSTGTEPPSGWRKGDGDAAGTARGARVSARRQGAAAVAAILTLLCAADARAQQDRPQARSMVASRFGVVAAEHPLAAQAGAFILAHGGTAADAAVAANAVMGVVAPMMDGVGGDLVAMVDDPRIGEPVGLDAIGWSPAAASVGRLTGRDGDRVPARGIDAVTVPGTVDGWDKLLRRFGRLSFADVLAPAISVAETGFPVSEVFAGTWAAPASLDALRSDAEAARVFLPGGAPPAAGQVFADADLAGTLRLIASGGRDGFYGGETAAHILEASARRGGAMQASDLSGYASEWVRPISGPYRGWTVYEMPPSTMGFTVLEMLGIMGRAPLGLFGRDSVQSLHWTIEAKKLAYADLLRFDGDPRASRVPIAGLLANEYARARASSIDPGHAACAVGPGRPAEPGGDTTYVAAVDRDGMMVSLMQSNFWEFGSGIVPEHSGFALGNRGRLFSLDPASPNLLAGHRRPLHTLIPAFMTKGAVRIAFGIMGGFNQAQAQAQFVSNVADFGMDIQAALEAPRFSKPTFEGCDVDVEDRTSPSTLAGLVALGHEVRLRGAFSPEVMGGGQAVERDAATGTNFGASDPRKDGEAIPEPFWLSSTR